MNPLVSRRHFIKSSSITLAGIPLARWQKKDSTAVIPSVKLHWLDKKSVSTGTTWGVPWPKGLVKAGTAFQLRETDALQTWPLAYWPDGSLKWTGHAIGANKSLPEQLEMIQVATNERNAIPALVTENEHHILVQTGVMECEVLKKGDVIIRSLRRNQKTIARNGRLVLQPQSSPDEESHQTSEVFQGLISSVTVEQNGPLRSVIKVEGSHSDWLPFVIRLYFYKNSEALRIVHTIIFNGDEQKHFVKGLGIHFDIPLKDRLYNRHIRFVGQDQGVFGEAVQGLTGLRRDPGAAVRQAQVAGKTVPEPLSEYFQSHIQYVPAFGDYTLFQPTSDAFQIQKRTQTGYAWIQSDLGKRASGTGYIGSPQGGLAFGIRNFWQSFPAQLDIRKAHTETAGLTLWLWAPKASAMDLRFYHDGMGQDTFEKQREGLDITYEDYEPGFGTAVGVARTSEVQVWVLEETPSHERLVDIAQTIQQPPQLVVSPEYIKEIGVFGNCWSLPSTQNSAAQLITRQLDDYFDYYQKLVEQRNWYGFWNYGDVMHSYDSDRHTWKYDVGGFAWDNSELSTDLWLWYYFLHSGRHEAFRMAEAMTRHTGEVDVHHVGKFSPLGSRHNVQHWGCSAKQLRISTVANRRFFYYLTADERVGDLMKEQIYAVKTLREIIPGRKIHQKAPSNDPQGNFASVSFGTDWGAVAAAWLTEWERTQNPEIRQKLLNSMQTIAQQPHGFFTGVSDMDLRTGKFRMAPESQLSVSHLSAVFGLAEICFELVDVVKDPNFEKAWLQYCELYNASPEEQKAVLGQDLGKLNLGQGHSRLTAFAAYRKKDAKLAQRAWKEFYAAAAGIKDPSLKIKHLKGPEVLNPIDEAAGVSTNAVAQWGLAAMQCLAFAGNPTGK